MSNNKQVHVPNPEDVKLEAGGWISMIAILFLFPEPCSERLQAPEKGDTLF